MNNSVFYFLHNLTEIDENDYDVDVGDEDDLLAVGEGIPHDTS